MGGASGLGAALAAVALAGAAPAEDAWPDWLAVHGQATAVLQATPGFRSPYAGRNSLTPRQRKETVDVTLFVGVAPWTGGEFWINPEIDQGFGLSNTLGVAGFPSAEAYKVGQKSPYVRVQRAFFRQTVALGGVPAPGEGGANQFAGPRAPDRLVMTIGKFGVGDVFDTNRYAHDPRGDLLNWSIVDAGTFDYAADAWGYSLGAAGEWYRGAWTVRLGLFNLSTVPNGTRLETGFGQFQADAEVEHRHRLLGRDGALKVTLFRNRGRFGRFADALALAARTGTVPDTALVRARRTRWGADLNLEQAVSDTVGVFARAGAADGNIEPYDFTDIDRTLAAGVQVAGAAWGRPDDEAGLAGVANAITAAHRRYLAAGGYGLLIGDGRLPRAGAELIGEAHYTWRPARPVALTFDYQLVGRPGYNRQRGPANIFGVRVHGAF